MEVEYKIIDLKLDEYNNIVIENIEETKPVNKKYTPANLLAQQKYRQKYPEKYCEQQRKLYNRLKDDDEWKHKFNERCRINNKIYRDKKKAEILGLGIEVKKRGRPRKS